LIRIVCDFNIGLKIKLPIIKVSTLTMDSLNYPQKLINSAIFRP
jgi:hypothetical protein